MNITATPTLPVPNPFTALAAQPLQQMFALQPPKLSSSTFYRLDLRHSTEGLKAGYRVVRRTKEDQYEVVSAGVVTKQPSAQTAELEAMIEALKWAKGKRVNIYSDSAYVVGAVCGATTVAKSRVLDSRRTAY
ncbi:hypothetical protein Q8A73_000122 [Channa argus]|nr:hypothetical protein Q8A73_000122 [Channa argus]